MYSQHSHTFYYDIYIERDTHLRYTFLSTTDISMYLVKITIH